MTAWIHMIPLEEATGKLKRGPRPATVALDAIETLERDLGARLPAAYRRFLHEQGPISTPTIPSMVWEAREDIVPVWPVSRFLHPSDAMTATHNAWRSGLPRHFVVFAEGPDGTLNTNRSYILLEAEGGTTAA